MPLVHKALTCTILFQPVSRETGVAGSKGNLHWGDLISSYESHQSVLVDWTPLPRPWLLRRAFTGIFQMEAASFRKTVGERSLACSPQVPKLALFNGWAVAVHSSPASYHTPNGHIYFATASCSFTQLVIGQQTQRNTCAI